MNTPHQSQEGRGERPRKVPFRPRPNKLRPMPEDFPTLAGTMSIRALLRHYRAGAATVGRWEREAGISAQRSPGTRALRPIPADFATQALTMTKHALADHYRTHWSTVQRWAEEGGIAPYVRQPKPKPEKRIPRPNGYAGPNPAFASRLPHDTSLEGQAADYLRCETRAIIYRCNERGAVPDLPMRRAGREHLADRSSLKFWRIGNAVVTPEELIARARRRGWVSLGELLSGHHGAKGFVTCLALARAEP